MRALAERVSTIISLWPKNGFQSNRMSGFYEMPPNTRCEAHQKVPCRVCKQYAELKVRKGADFEDVGENKSRKSWIDDRELAQDLASQTPHYGVLAIDGDEPTDEELETAFNNIEAYYSKVLENENRFHQTTGKPYNREHATMAAEYFGVQPPWMADTRPKKPCPACSSHNVWNAVRCASPTCGAIIDWEAARANGILTERQEDFALAEGLLKPVGTKSKTKAEKQVEL